MAADRWEDFAVDPNALGSASVQNVDAPADREERRAPPPVVAGEAEPPWRARRRRLRRIRRSIGLVLLWPPLVAVVVIDASRRSHQLVEFDSHYRWAYAGAMAESLMVWATLLYAACAQRGAVRWIMAALFVIGITFTFGGQAYFYQQYNAYLN